MTTPNINVHTQEFLEDPNAALGCPHARAASAIGTSGPEFFDFDTVESIFKESRVRPKNAQVYLDMGLSKESVIYEFLTTGNFNMMTDEDHKRIRPIILKGFRPKRIKQAEPMIREIARELIDEMIAKGETANLVHDFSHWVSVRTISGFIGVPKDDVFIFDDATVELIRLGTVPFEPQIEHLEKALKQIYKYVKSLILIKRDNPAEDFISDLVEIQASGEHISEKELIWCVVFLLLAGHDTTRAGIASASRALIETDNWEKIYENPDLVKTAVTETLRMYPPAYRFPRLVREDLQVAEYEFKKDDLLAANLAGAGRDPEKFANPDTFDLTREGPKFDIGFGYGQHHCIGSALATVEITQSLLELTSRLTDVKLTSPVEYRVGGVIAGPEYVNISFKARGEE